MILNRLGNKKELADKIISYFPKDITCFIDLFFGSGAITWAMLDLFPNLYYIANDKDNDVFNLWQVLIDSDKADDVPVAIVADKVEVKASVKSEKVEVKEVVEEKVEAKAPAKYEKVVEEKVEVKKEDTKSKK